MVERINVQRREPSLEEEVISRENDRVTEADISHALEQQDPESIARDDKEPGLNLHAGNDVEQSSE